MGFTIKDIRDRTGGFYKDTLSSTPMEEYFVTLSSSTNSEGNKLELPLFSSTAERVVLGSLLLSANKGGAETQRLSKEDFYFSEHQIIFSVMKKLALENLPLDVISVADDLANLNELENIGGLRYLGELAAETSSTNDLNASASACVIRERAALRNFVQGITVDYELSLTGRVTHKSSDLSRINATQPIDRKRVPPKFQLIGPALRYALDLLGMRFQSDTSSTLEMDESAAEGLGNGDLLLFSNPRSSDQAARSETNIALSKGSDKLPILVYSREMSSDSIALCILSVLEPGLGLDRLVTGNMLEDDWPKLSNAVNSLKRQAMHVDVTTGLNLHDVLRDAQVFQRLHGSLGLILLGDMQLTKTLGSELGGVEISDISNALRHLADRLACPVMARLKECCDVGH